MVFDKIKKIIQEQLGIHQDKITMDTSFEELGVDSLEFFQIIIEIEEQFEVQIEDTEAITTVSEAVRFVEEKQKECNAIKNY
ncbi:acyl carrier protein [Clostridium scatologenes]|uniref:Acyl carrier protein n=1 Tax=Clostridium scatologenes TaxID=1548 RepID=A0A0E3K3K1_CLOSL|nr:acyl carrier protein [Clostridium scatologenes]AKA71293.1 phosphopantetheine-binding [Clostridium scatologenes]